MPRCAECGTDRADPAGVCPACSTQEQPVRCRGCGELFQPIDACPACGLARLDLVCDRHPSRRAVGRCVICARAVCRRCNEGGRIHRCGEHAQAVVIQGWAQIYSTTSEFEARLVRENLQAEGIDARIYSQRDNMLSLGVGELSIVRILVPAWEYEQANGLIRDHLNEAGEVTFACPTCGEAYEPDVPECTSCGSALTRWRPD